MDDSATNRQQIMAWRREERQRLLEERMRMPVAERQQASARIIGGVDALWRGAGRLKPGTIVSAYWPLRGEPDLRPWLAELNAQGLVCVLPVVVEKGEPLQFRRWSQAAPWRKVSGTSRCRRIRPRSRRSC